MPRDCGARFHQAAVESLPRHRRRRNIYAGGNVIEVHGNLLSRIYHNDFVGWARRQYVINYQHRRIAGIASQTQFWQQSVTPGLSAAYRLRKWRSKWASAGQHLLLGDRSCSATGCTVQCAEAAGQGDAGNGGWVRSVLLLVAPGRMYEFSVRLWWIMLCHAYARRDCSTSQWSGGRRVFIYAPMISCGVVQVTVSGGFWNSEARGWIARGNQDGQPCGISATLPRQGTSSSSLARRNLWRRSRSSPVAMD
jgi:hypothetical protein